MTCRICTRDSQKSLASQSTGEERSRGLLEVGPKRALDPSKQEYMQQLATLVKNYLAAKELGAGDAHATSLRRTVDKSRLKGIREQFGELL